MEWRKGGKKGDVEIMNGIETFGCNTGEVENFNSAEELING